MHFGKFSCGEKNCGPANVLREQISLYNLMESFCILESQDSGYHEEVTIVLIGNNLLIYILACLEPGYNYHHKIKLLGQYMFPKSRKSIPCLGNYLGKYNIV